MASADMVVLSSSPPTQFKTFEVFSSPSFPSSSDIFHKKIHILRTGKQAAPIPQNALASFTTASSLLRGNLFDNLSGSETTASLVFGAVDRSAVLENVQKLDKVEARKMASGSDNFEIKGKAAKTSRKKATIDNVAEGKQPRNPRLEKSELKEDGIPKQKPPPKPRAKKTVVEFDDDENVKAKPRPESRVKKGAAGIIEDGSIKPKGPRKSRAKKLEPAALDDDNGTAGKAVKKSRAKKGNTQTKIGNAKVTKPSSYGKADSIEDNASAKEPECTSRHFAGTNRNSAGSLDTGLAPAVKRRVAWTPPQAAHSSILLDLPTPTDEIGNESFIADDTLRDRSQGFTDLFGSFGFSRSSAASPAKLADGAGPKKRKLIELVRTNTSNLSTTEAAAAPKPKVIKKKARTLTELATSEYAQKEDIPKPPAPLFQYLSLQTIERKTSDGFTVPPKPRSKSPVKKASKGKGKGTEQAPILLSPESALKQVGGQDFVFGTSSQLAQEESPSFLRDIHAAMQASNALDEEDPLVDHSLHAHSISNSNGLRKSISTKYGLWSAAARNISGELMDVEMVDLINSPAIILPRNERIMEHHAPPSSQVHSEVWHDLDDVTSSPLPPHAVSNQEKKFIGPVEAAIRNELLSSPLALISQPAASPKISNKLKQSKSPSKAGKVPAKSSQGPKSLKSKMPDFAAYTTTQLTKEVASYHFKPIKNRDQMISLLGRCWEGKQRLVLQALGTNTIVGSSEPNESNASPKKTFPSSQMEVESPKRPRGRPRKDNGACSSPKSKSKVSMTVEDLELNSDTPLSQMRTPKKGKKKAAQKEDISDSDTYITPSPPRRRPSQVGKPPLPLKTASASVEDSTIFLTESSQLQLFKHITHAVKAAPRSKDSKIPSWHEKILLYDPIILEDLAIWLNSGALDKTGWDGEVEPKEVKKWCESKSICCLWKENLRGGARSRY
jgi:hypothetical protein